MDVRFHLDSVTFLTPEIKSKIRAKFSNELTGDGFLVAKSDRTRSQMLNKADALRKLRDFIWTAASEESNLEKLSSSKQMQKELERKARLKDSRARLRERKVQN